MKYKDIAEKWSRRTNVPAALILAVIHMESGGDENAMRCEPAYERRYNERCRQLAKAARIPVMDVASSYGLMQLMLPTAWGYMSIRERETPVACLYDPDCNIRYGAAHLATCLKGTKEINAAAIREAAGKYNGAGGNSAYARNVCALWRAYEEALSC